MNYPRIFERLYSQPLAITDARFHALHDVFFRRISTGSDFSSEAALAAAKGPQYRENKSIRGRRAQVCAPVVDWEGRIIDPHLFSTAKEGVAVVPVYGALAKNLSAFEERCGGGTDINPIGEALLQAADASGIHTVLLDVDSPGGEVRGIPETAARIRALSQQKRVVAFTDASCFSAAYWLASQAGEFYATRSSGLGSIGVRAGWLDRTVQMQMQGLKLEQFTAGKHKGAGAPYRGLSDEERAMIQAEVNQCYGQFTAAVQEARPRVTMDAMQGQTFTAVDALAQGLIDGLVADWEALVDML